MIRQEAADVERRTAVVTGASSGIGREIALQLAELGWHVVAVARSQDKLDELASQAPTIEARPADLAALDVAGLLPGRIDAVVHAAAISTGGTVEEVTPQDWQEAFTLNVFAGAELARQALPALRASQGIVVFINSGAGIAPEPASAIYGASKHALRILANVLRNEVQDDGVRVTTVFPGPTDTPMYTADVPRETLIQPATVARAVVAAITASPDTQLTEIQVRPRRELNR